MAKEMQSRWGEKMPPLLISDPALPSRRKKNARHPSRWPGHRHLRYVVHRLRFRFFGRVVRRSQRCREAGCRSTKRGRCHPHKRLAARGAGRRFRRSQKRALVVDHLVLGLGHMRQSRLRMEQEVRKERRPPVPVSTRVASA